MSFTPHPDLQRLRVAIVHQWFVDWGGAENVVEVIADLFPQADLFTLMCDPRILPPELKRRKIQTTFLQHVPGRFRFRRHLMPLYPLALEHLDVKNYDLVISSESAPAKGVITSPDTLHICYCHTPMRYIWDMFHEYKRALRGPLARSIFGLTAHYMRLWDLATARRVDHFVANSHYVAQRIRKFYGREAAVIHPPVRLAEGRAFTPAGDYYLVLGRLVDYKRVDLAVSACNRLHRRLKIVGGGPQYETLRRMAGPTVEFLGPASGNQVKEAYAGCRALLFAAEEDFGLVPVEAQSFGRPVIAYARGGALETVNGLFPGDAFSADASGVFFREQSVDSVVESIRYFESIEDCFLPEHIRERVALFGAVRFRASFEQFVRSKLAEFQQRSETPPSVHYRMIYDAAAEERRL